jgi:hypothetical protein
VAQVIEKAPYRAAAPFAAVAGEALGGPAGAAARGAFGVGGQVALAPMVYVPRLAARTVRRVLLAVRRREVHTLPVDIVLTNCTQKHYPVVPVG